MELEVSRHAWLQHESAPAQLADALAQPSAQTPEMQTCPARQSMSFRQFSQAWSVQMPLTQLAPDLQPCAQTWSAVQYWKSGQPSAAPGTQRKQVCTVASHCGSAPPHSASLLQLAHGPSAPPQVGPVLPLLPEPPLELLLAAPELLPPPDEPHAADRTARAAKRTREIDEGRMPQR